MRKTKLEIIEETALYYSEDVSRRALNHLGQCRYLTSDGKMCSVGRCLISPSYGSQWSVSWFRDLEEELKEEYKGHSLDFWNKLQKFHDWKEHWSSTGLTEEGEKYLQNLKNQFSN